MNSKGPLMRGLLLAVMFFLGVLISGVVQTQAATARRYQYKVISVTGMTELRTQSHAEEGRLPALEKVINEQASQGWELFQADGYVLYFRR